MSINIKYRTEKTEIMDDFSLEGEELVEALDKIARINQLLGGNKLTINGLRKLLKQTDCSNTVCIADIGCGNGDMLRMLATFGIKNGLNFKLIGIDANAFTVNHARKLSANYPNITYDCIDIFSADFQNLKYDIALCTLTLHHFSNEKVMDLITIFNSNARLGVVINDLQRSKLAYRLFIIISIVFGLKHMSREDGLVSILRGFRKEELINFSETLQLRNYTVLWKWAFRYQWIITKI
ncbi:methyltransferase domain-containing protein [Flavobacterium sp. NKUCC04_CG]|uniref:methyltransferase domain-containing protein n=1 Tax=Flavobacterium sp. NKUCC04_CG TaxID=2842121 RepID=UPI001C5B3C82|nr:methyltransferase domain-containing protein [Flavobacterium sp. NKUCC04_CG]MBW3518621.1 methyltransferase domain-containing protein [Flavobacterium sp. NKUCC04_CG]